MKRTRTRKSTTAHRIAYELYIGPIPQGLFVCHKCDTPLCVNPEHLFLGTPKDNIQDMIRKGRNKVLRGSKQTTAKLNEDVVHEILISPLNNHELARKFLVSRTLIIKIKQKKKWAHVTAD